MASLAVSKTEATQTPGVGGVVCVRIMEPHPTDSNVGAAHRRVEREQHVRESTIPIM